MKQTTGDFSLFFKRVKNKRVGLSGSYVDDVLRAGTADFLSQATKATASRFDVKPADNGKFEFVGLETGDAGGMRTLS
jgi:hypothetical protein